MVIVNFLSFFIFFSLFYLYDIVVATIYMCFYYLLSFLFLKIYKGFFDFKLLFYFFIFLIFGSMSFFFKDDIFIKWKVTIIYWFFACACFSFYIFNVSFFSNHLLKHNIKISHNISTYLNLSFFLFFLFLGSLNLYIAYTYSTKFWFMFKIVGFSLISLVFLFIQSVVIVKYVKSSDD